MRNNNLIIFEEGDLDDCLKILNTDLCETIDLIKVTTSAITSEYIDPERIKELVQESKNKGAKCYLGGGVTENAIENSELSFSKYINELQSLGIEVIEVSNTLGENNDSLKLKKLVNRLSGEFDRVLVEIGSKKESGFSVDYKNWKKSIYDAINAGADGIIIEGGLGNVGIYDKDYKTKTLLLIYIIKKISEAGFNKDVIIETKPKNLQNYIMSLLGPGVKLGNICLRDTKLENINSNRFMCQRTRANFNEGEGNLEQEKITKKYFEVIDEIFEFCKKYDVNPNYFLFNPFYYDLNLDLNLISSGIKKEMLSITGELNDSGLVFPSNPELFFKTMGKNVSSFTKECMSQK